jgi:hypothetical protein
VAIAKVAFVTDSSGRIYLGDSSTGGSMNPPVPSVPVVVAGGVWDTTALTGWDSAALTDFGGRTLFNGLVRLP